MCVFKSPKIPDPPKPASTDYAEAVQQSDIEARLRKRRAGAAADVLTGPTGIPATQTLGGTAQ
ncbi:hypothetical protein [Cereibacter azotoformans]|uniref:hypothetical protein n=1 Tax=Cereibacter azotoformans TaxID=43057 RepID=UPI000C6D12A6|nr:hypothetical protein [Cereibacter azotoformans]